MTSWQEHHHIKLEGKGDTSHRSICLTATSILANYKAEGKLVLFQAFDISKFFDKEVLHDAMNTHA